MRKSAALLFFVLVFFCGPVKAEETRIHFDCGAYYFSQGPYASEFQFQEFIQATQLMMTEEFEKVEGEIKGSIQFKTRYFRGSPGDEVQRGFSETHPAVVFIEGAGGASVFEEFRKSGTYPRILIFLNAPDAGMLAPDFPVDKVISLFGDGAPESSRIEIKDPRRDFNLQIKGSSYVNLWQDLKLQKFLSDILKIALLESLFPEQQTKEPV